MKSIKALVTIADKISKISPNMGTSIVGHVENTYNQ
jgi:hypothetical protein